jgi:hypothetical protein
VVNAWSPPPNTTPTAIEYAPRELDKNSTEKITENENSKGAAAAMKNEPWHCSTAPYRVETEIVKRNSMKYTSRLADNAICPAS